MNGLVEAHFRAHGLEVVEAASFKLAGDPDMNRVSAECLVRAVSVGADADAEALFVSTGLRTTPLVAGMEAKPASRWSPATKRSPGTASDSAA